MSPKTPCIICGLPRVTKNPKLPCTICRAKGKRVSAADLEFILDEARQVWAADEADHQQRIEQEAQRGNKDIGPEVAAQGSGAEHRPARPVNRRSGPHVGAVAGHRR